MASCPASTTRLVCRPLAKELSTAFLAKNTAAGGVAFEERVTVNGTAAAATSRRRSLCHASSGLVPAPLSPGASNFSNSSSTSCSRASRLLWLGSPSISGCCAVSSRICCLRGARGRAGGRAAKECRARLGAGAWRLLGQNSTNTGPLHGSKQAWAHASPASAPACLMLLPPLLLAAAAAAVRAGSPPEGVGQQPLYQLPVCQQAVAPGRCYLHALARHLRERGRRGEQWTAAWGT